MNNSNNSIIVKMMIISINCNNVNQYIVIILILIWISYESNINLYNSLHN